MGVFRCMLTYVVKSITVVGANGEIHLFAAAAFEAVRASSKT